MDVFGFYVWFRSRCFLCLLVLLTPVGTGQTKSANAAGFTEIVVPTGAIRMRLPPPT